MAKLKTKHFVTKAEKVGNKTYRFIASTEQPDRLGDIIITEGWDVSNWEKNPVVLWDHNRSDLPIGKGRVSKDSVGKRLLVEVDFVPEDVYPFAGTVQKLVDKGFLRSVSVGFKPIEQEDLGYKDDSWFPATKYLKQELVEISIVPVPMNPEAIVILNSLERGEMSRRGVKIKALPSPKKKKKPFPPEEEEEPKEGEEEETEAPEGKEGKEEVPPGEEEEQDPNANPLENNVDPNIQALIFTKAVFASLEAAQQWAQAHDFIWDNVQETEMAFVIVQKPREDFDEASLNIVQLDNGVMALSGKMMEMPPGQMPTNDMQQQQQEMPMNKAFCDSLLSNSQKNNELLTDLNKNVTELNVVIKSLAKLAELVKEPEAPSTPGNTPKDVVTEELLKELELSLKKVGDCLLVTN